MNVIHASILFLSFTSVLQIVAGYDIRCVFPHGWFTNPFEAQTSLSVFFEDFMVTNKVETPIVVRTAHHATMCRGICLAYHDNDVLDPFDKMPTFVTVPPFGQNANAITMCIAQCYIHVLDGFGDYSDEMITYFGDEYGLQLAKPQTRNDILQAWYYMEVLGNAQPMMNILEAEDYHPITMGHVAGVKARYYADQDGWNSLGLTTYSHELGEEVPCTSSCRTYQDTAGYSPVPDPRIHTFLSNDTSKYDCTGDCRRWQPLQEGDELGNLKNQEFVTPHLGAKAVTYLRPKSITLQDPEYDLYEESLLVIERLKNTTTDVYMQDAVEVFDGKLGVRGIITKAIRQQVATSRIHSYQDEVLFKVGLSTVEYDAVVQAWTEKAYHDLVRPTTVIKHWGDDDLYTYGGDSSLGSPVTIKARDFEAYIRVMPHAEFPSGSSCLCTAYYEFTDLYMMNMYDMSFENLAWAHKGRQYTLTNMEELRDVCGESRLWGGMHYDAAIPAGEQVCSGLDVLAYDYVTDLKNGSNFNGGTGPGSGPWYWGDDIGQCGGEDYKYDDLFGFLS